MREESRTRRGRKRTRDRKRTIEREKEKRVWVKEYFVIPVAAREYQNGKRLASINHVYSGPMSQVTVVHYVNARVHPLSSLSLSFTHTYTYSLLFSFALPLPLGRTAPQSVVNGGYRFLGSFRMLLYGRTLAMTQLRTHPRRRTHTHAQSRPDEFLRDVFCSIRVRALNSILVP